MTDRFWYREESGGQLTLLRMFSTSEEVTVPEQISGKPVTAIGEYCFSEKCRYTGEEASLHAGTSQEEISNASLMQLLQAQKLRPSAGRFLTRIHLPETIQQIGSLAFYQCSRLEEISLAGNPSSLGSDVFMNCHSLRQIILKLPPAKTLILRQALAQLNREITVYWESQELQAAVLFPEYTEGYDLIGPAHIFGLNIEGEGFRARQCFSDGIFEFTQYDQIFAQASHTEDEATLCRMAALRLTYPEKLEDTARKQYQTYLADHIGTFCQEAVRQKETSLLASLFQQGYLTGQQIDLCIQRSTQARWIQGTRTFLAWKNSLAGQQEKPSDKYIFDRF